MILKEEQDILFMSSLQNLSSNNLPTQRIQVSTITTEKLNNKLEVVADMIAHHYAKSEILLKSLT